MQAQEESPVTTDIIKQEVRPPVLKFTAAEIKADVNLIQQVLKAVFIEDVHFGIVPGCGDKKVLLKPGAEKIMTTFRLNGVPVIEDLSSSDEIRYRVSIKVLHQVTRDEIGWGVGECSSSETKYKWIKADAYTWDGTPEDQRREIQKNGKDGGKPYKIKQVRANISDVANTILKMAKKRALVDATLTCTAASDVFAQDLEEMSPELARNVADENHARNASGVQRASNVTEPTPQNPVVDTKPPKGVIVPEDIAKHMNARFDAPCKACGKKVIKETPIIYVGEGPLKGGYHVDCVTFAGE